jgi:phage-related tail protein
MHRNLKQPALLTALALALACQRGEKSDVEQQTKELREAQSRSPEVAKNLEADLAKAKAEVVRLEQKLALARQGVTDDVLNERKDLEQSLQNQERHVQSEINEAKREAAQHNQDTLKATQALQGTQPPQVRAEVKTETRVTPAPAPSVQTTERQELIPVRGQDKTTLDAGANGQRVPPQP